MTTRSSDLTVDPVLEAARTLTRNLPADQALGLRLLALASAASRAHMAASVVGPDAHATQAAGLVAAGGAAPASTRGGRA